MDEINTCFLKLFGYIDHVVQCQTPFTVLISGNTNINNEIITTKFTDLCNYFKCQSETSVNVSAVLICSLIIKWCKESTEQSMRMCTLNLDSVSACDLETACSLSKLLNKYMQFFYCYCSRCLFCIIRTDIGRCDQLRRSRNWECHISRME